MDSGNPILLSLKNLDIGFPEKILIHDINASVTRGELVAVIGHNGAGKSTLLRTIAGFHSKGGGEILIGGRERADMSRRELASSVGYVSTEQVNAPDMRVYDLVALGRFSYTNWMGSLTDNDKRIVHESIAKVGLSGFIFRNIGQLSDGEKQRAMIARALAQDTSLLIMDEPTAFLDLKNRYEIIHLLRSLAASGEKTVIMSTHDLQSALRESDKIWLLANGNLEEGAPEDMVLKGSFDGIFGDSQLKFRKSDGSFYPLREETGDVCINGEGLFRQWTARAMRRLGFRIRENPVSGGITITIDEKRNEWVLERGESQLTFGSLYSLSAWIRSNT
jgi:iron complex transport system ATP-binding protein